MSHAYDACRGAHAAWSRRGGPDDDGGRPGAIVDFLKFRL
eukprot:SAG31_NODE_46697_length_253_cov_0.746753_1_plen_39_part_01